MHPQGVTPATLASFYPRLYHMAHEDAWESIRRHGLLSTSSLLDLWQVGPADRGVIERRIRKTSVELLHARHGMLVIRDQKPMHEGQLSGALIDCTVEQWCHILNRKVFFWPNLDRLGRHMGAKLNRESRHMVLTLDTYRLASAYEKRLRLCSINSGSTMRFARKRGRDSFLPLSKYPFQERLARGTYAAVAEVAVERGVPEILEFVISADYMKVRDGVPCRLANVYQSHAVRDWLRSAGSLRSGMDQPNYIKRQCCD